MDSGLKSFKKMIDDEINGVKPRYRSKEWHSHERKILKSQKKTNWWNGEKSKTQYKSVLFVTPIPGGVLAKELQKREEELNKNTKEHARCAPEVILLTFRRTKQRLHVIQTMWAIDGSVRHAKKGTSLKFMKVRLEGLPG